MKYGRLKLDIGEKAFCYKDGQLLEQVALSVCVCILRNIKCLIGQDPEQPAAVGPVLCRRLHQMISRCNQHQQRTHHPSVRRHISITHLVYFFYYFAIFYMNALRNNKYCGIFCNLSSGRIKLSVKLMPQNGHQMACQPNVFLIPKIHAV